MRKTKPEPDKSRATCPICGKTFTNGIAYIRHIKNHGNGGTKKSKK